MKNRIALATVCLSAFLGSNAFSAVSESEAAKLGNELTPMGAEAAGNADGSIPPWNPNGPPVPANFVAGSDNYVNAYPDEKPLLSIDVNNWEQYSDNLTAGTRGMFKTLGPAGFRMDVYPTKRDAVFPDWAYANARKNATGATLVADGQKIEGNYPGTPFPIPQSGLEVMWNHMIRIGGDRSMDYDVFYVSSKGKPILSTTGESYAVYPMYANPDQVVGDAVYTKLRINYNAPARRAGEILLIHEPGADYTAGKGRKAWQYLTGQRRVRLAPAVSFDTPNPGVAGTTTYDDSFIYNGSPERFDWTLVGKKEIYVPYSSYKFMFEHKIQDILGEKFLKPEYIRWEKHRVWVVESNLKEGKRHIYDRRTFYVDEDTWNAVAGETYDGQGNLWRVQFAYGAALYDQKAYYGQPYGAYDLLQGIYNINSKPIPGKFRNGVKQGDKYFTSKGMARGGIR